MQPEDTGLPGTFERSIKVSFLGAGSMFTPRLMNDLFRVPGLGGGEIALVDIDRERLATMAGVIRRLAEERNVRDWKVTASPDRLEVLRGTDYVINCIEVSGLECVRHDNDIPLRYGIDQCIGDTIGPGGLFKALRTIPVWLEILRDLEEHCPGALVLNYTNPMSMMCLSAARASRMSVVGLCHSVQETSHLLARRARVPYDEMVWDCAGINHLSWFTRLEHGGKDLYPRLKARARRDLSGRPADGEDAWDLIRKDVMIQFGAFVTESSGHLSEYLPYYRKRKDLIREYCRPGYHGQSRFYASEWPRWRRAADRERRAMLRGDRSLDWARSLEYASWIIEAREKKGSFRFYGNVMNGGAGSESLITNLPRDGCVELACIAGEQGITPVPFGALPPQMAALCDWNMRMFDMAVRAAIGRSKELAIQALLLDPLTAAVLSPAEIREMTLALFRAEKRFLKGYR